MTEKEKSLPEEKQGAGEGVEDLAADVAAKMPDVSEHVVEAEGKGAKGPGGREVGKTDAWGREFDPALHEMQDGRPVLTPGGFFKCKPGKAPGGQGRPRKAAKKSRVAAPDPLKAEQEVKDVLREQEISAAAKTAAEVTFMFGQIIGGPEWAPMGGSGDSPKIEAIDERAMMQSAYYDYFEARGVVNLPPGLSLSLALFYYAVARVTMPTTQTRLQKLGGWIRRKLVNLKLLRAKHGTRPDTGTDRERKDNASKEADPEPKG